MTFLENSLDCPCHGPWPLCAAGAVAGLAGPAGRAVRGNTPYAGAQWAFVAGGWKVFGVEVPNETKI